MANIDFCVCVGNGAVKWAEFLHHTSSSLSSGQHQIRYIAGLSGHTQKPDGFDVSCVAPRASANTGFNHMLCLETLYKHSEAEYIILSDADVAICMQGWDSIALSHLTGNCIAFGFALIHKYRYRDFPYVNWICMQRDKIKECGAQFMTPENKVPKHPSIFMDEEQCKLFGYDKPTYIDVHTAWKFCSYFKQNGYTGYSMYPSEKLILPECQWKKPWHEFHYDGKLFGTHLCNSCRDSIKNPRPAAWMQHIRDYIGLDF